MATPRLSPRVYDRVLRSLLQLYACHTIEQLRQSTVATLDTLIGSDGSGWFDYDNGGRLLFVLESVPCLTSAIIEKMPRAMSSHPFLTVWPAQADPSVLKLSDFPAAVRRRHLDENWDAYREIGVENMAGPIALDGQGVTAVSLRRQRKRFEERDRAIVELLKPHLRQALSNVRLFEATQRAAVQLTNGTSRAQSLTERESQVAFWLAEGKTNVEIGLILSVSPRTVEKHVESILRKLHVENRTTAAMAVRAQLSSVPQPETGGVPGGSLRP